MYPQYNNNKKLIKKRNWTEASTWPDIASNIINCINWKWVSFGTIDIYKKTRKINRNQCYWEEENFYYSKNKKMLLLSLPSKILICIYEL
jgi:hypothetical protein